MGLTIAQIGNEDEERRQMMLDLAKERDLDLTVKCAAHPTPAHPASSRPRRWRSPAAAGRTRPPPGRG